MFQLDPEVESDVEQGFGLAVLIGTGRRARLLGGFLRLAAVSPQVDRGLHITGLRQHLGV